jgi:hypothetical protein
MPVTIVDVSTESLFDLITKTNQLINQYNETNTLAVNAYNTTNAASFTAANISSEILIANSEFINVITTSVSQSEILINEIASNTIILSGIYDNSNVIANAQATLIVTDAGYVSNIANLIIGDGSLTAAVLANTQLTDQVYLNANSIASAFNANSNLGLAWSTANSAFTKANTANSDVGAAFFRANQAFTKANTANNDAIAAFTKANTANNDAISAFLRANIAYAHANAAFAQANTGSPGGTGVITLNDETTDAVRYVVFANTTTGNVTSLNVASDKLTFNPSTGALSATLFNSLSDENQKENIRLISDPVWRTDQLRGVQFNFKDGGAPSAGIIAQDLQRILPELVNPDMSVTYSGVIGLLVEAVKELNRRIVELENK